MMTFDISNLITILDMPIAERNAYLDEHYRPGFVSDQARQFPEPLYIIEYAVAFPAMLKQVRTWLEDDRIEAHEIAEIMPSDTELIARHPEFSVEALEIKFAEGSLQKTERMCQRTGLSATASNRKFAEAWQPVLIRHHRQNIVNTYRAQFNRLPKSIWDKIDIHPNELDPVIVELRAQALKLLRDLINRAITTRYGGVATFFHIGENEQHWKWYKQ